MNCTGTESVPAGCSIDRKVPPQSNVELAITTIKQLTQGVQPGTADEASVQLRAACVLLEWCKEHGGGEEES